jgi:hypothetical protein
MKRYHNQIILICPAARQAAANAAALQALGPGHENTFSSPYSKSGNAPATHYVACGQMTDSFIPKLLALADAFPQIKAIISGPGNFTEISKKPNAKTQKKIHDTHEELEKEDLKPVRL